MIAERSSGQVVIQCFQCMVDLECIKDLDSVQDSALEEVLEEEGMVMANNFKAQVNH